MPKPKPPLHSSCRCVIENMESITGTATINGTDGADWTLKQEGKLPEYYILYDDIMKLGWHPGKSPSHYAPGKMITRGVYNNDDDHLPNKSGRIWYEADINYNQGKRNSQRVIWSNDGLIFITYDHYMTFNEIV